MTAQPGTPAQVVGDLVMIDPTQALIGANVRLDPRLDKQFLASIRERGVLVPVVGHRDADGRFVVLYGQRRTLAAVETKRERIPAYVVPGQEEADRLIDQMAENDHRAAISTSERVAGFEQLAALGLSAAQIAKRTATKRADVDTALVVSSSELASKALGRWDFLTLEQAAGLAEFDGDAEVVKALAAAAQQGRFEHTLQKARDDRDDAVKVAEFVAALEEAGVRVIDRPAYDDKSVLPVDRVMVDGKRVSREDHTSCPGHAAWVSVGLVWVDEATGEEIPNGYSTFDGDYEDDDCPTCEGSGQDDEGGECPDCGGSGVMEPAAAAPEVKRVQVRKALAHFACTAWKSQGHGDYYSSGSGSGSKPKAADMSDAEREKASAERRDVIESNKEWKSAEVVRREWLTSFLTRKTPPKGAGVFIAQTLLEKYSDRLTHMNTPAMRDKLLGVGTVTVDGLSDGRALVVSLGHVLAAYEGQTGTHTWRNPTEPTTRYFRFLQANGYVLCDVEARACLPE